MSLPKLHKLYFPGLISLVFLPVMCICYFVSNNTFHKYRVMDVTWADKQVMNKWLNGSGQRFDQETFRKYHILSLTGDPKHDTLELRTLKEQLAQLLMKNDTVNGIKISLGSHTQYGEYVSALDICFQDTDKYLSFNPMGYNIFISHLPLHAALLKERRFLPPCGGIVFCGTTIKATNDEPLNDKIIKAYRIIGRFWPSILMFIAMSFFTIFRWRRFSAPKTLKLSSH